MPLSRSQCDHLRRLCSGSLAEGSGALVESITCALGFSSQRTIATSAPAQRFSRVKDPVSHAGAVTGEYFYRRVGDIGLHVRRAMPTHNLTCCVVAGADPQVYLVDKVRSWVSVHVLVLSGCRMTWAALQFLVMGCAILPVKAELLQKSCPLQFLGNEVMSSSEARQQRIDEVVSTYQRYSGDTGSTEVQGVLSLLQSPCLMNYWPVCPFVAYNLCGTSF